MKTYVIVPARLDSKRLPGKMLLNETGMPLIKHTYDNIKHLVPGDDGKFDLGIDGIFIATPDDEIKKVCDELDVPVIKIDNTTLCGTHTCVTAAKELGICNIINLQGDNPLIDPDILPRISELMYTRNGMCSAYYTTPDEGLAKEPGNVKVVFDESYHANYFSRSVIPYGAKSWNIHIGVYGIPYIDHKHLLMQYEDWTWTIERYEDSMRGENLEQLMWLRRCKKIKMMKSKPCVSIDTREDYEQFKKHCLGG